MIEISNNQVVDIEQLEILSYDDLGKIAMENRFRAVTIGVKELAHDALQLFVVVTNNMYYFLATVVLERGKEYNSIAQKIPSWTNYERELYESYNIRFIGNPWLKPIRFAHDRELEMSLEDYPFFKISGDGVHEVAVGPVHAGVIEPGHFRFMCRGERIDHLEIQLGYQHRGVEKLLKSKNLTAVKTLIESIVGDSTVINSFLYASSLEALAKIKISDSAMAIRVIGIELERVALHFSTLSGIANDIAYLMGAAFAGATRTYVINSLQSICGNRFGHGLIGIGGVNFGIDEPLKEELIATLEMVSKRCNTLENNMLNSPSVLARLENTGVVGHDTAKVLGLTGVPAKAAGLNVDCRYHMNNLYYNRYRNDDLGHYHRSGDVLARTRQRFVEIRQSLALVIELLKNLNTQASFKEKVELSQLNLAPNRLVFSFGEGPRGENTHLILTNDSGEFALLYKLKDPSFVNWFALAMSVRGNQISDFPLCNKSFDLSYSGSDL